MSETEFYARGLKPTSVPSVWQLLDGSERFHVGIAAQMDPDERLAKIEVLTQQVRGF
jgi:hypothetical protein